MAFNLNKEQHEAAMHINGPIMVLAGAGSGKTRVLTERIANLIDKGVSPYNILAVTFTNKAAKEMRERVEKTLNRSVEGMWIATFHSMCTRILRNHIHLLGYDKQFNIIDSDDSKLLIRNIIKDTLKQDPKFYNPSNIMGLINKLNYEDDNTVVGALAHVKGDFKVVVEKTFEHYTDYKVKNSIIDFQDLLVKTIELFEKHPDVLQVYKNKFNYVLVDEFQDTNNLQFRLIDLLCSDSRNVFVVGDMDQSIYSFRGANYENINRFTGKYNPSVVKLEENYRSTKNILGAANSIIKNNVNRIDKTLFTSNEEGEKIIYFRAPSAFAEVDFVISQINLIRKHGKKYDDFVILYRKNAMSRLFEQGFNRAGIPYRVYGGVSFNDKKEIKDMSAYFKLILNANDNWSFRRVVNEPKRGIGPTTIEKLYDYSVGLGKSMFNTIEQSKSIFTKGTHDKLVDFREMIETCKRNIEEMPLNEFIRYIAETSGYNNDLRSMGEEGKIRIEYVFELENMAAELEKRSRMTQKRKVDLLAELVDSLSLREGEDTDDERGRVSLMTIHTAKGLEYPYVFIVGMEDGIFPSFQSLDSEYEMQEERRLCYVAMTRAESILYLTNALERMEYGNNVMNMPSKFISEIDPTFMGKYGVVNQVPRKTEKDKPIENNKSKLDLRTTDSYMNQSSVEFRAGDKIHHDSFGEGVVVSVDNDFIKVAFSVEHGIKSLMKQHKAIKKIG